jgi:hypothetical protein
MQLKKNSGSLMAAALAIPGLVIAPAVHAAGTQEPTIAVKYLGYSDSAENQGNRIDVHAPAYFFSIPVKDKYVVEGSYVLDSVSGASVGYYNTITTASIGGRRQGGDIKVTRLFDRTAIGVGYAISREGDYQSDAVGVDARFSSADNNTTLALGVGVAKDDISSSVNPSLDEKRDTKDFLVGVTQVLSPSDLVQSNLTYSRSRGYHSHTYKSFDRRPDARDQWAWLTRYLHYFSGPQAALHTSYRYYQSDWGVQAHTFEADWYQPLGTGWIIRPSFRYHVQSAADFYVDADPINILPPEATTAQFFTADNRLAAFGAITLGVKVSKEFANGFTVDAKYEWYQQRGSWYLGGEGSSGLDNFSAQWWQVGLSKKF